MVRSGNGVTVGPVSDSEGWTRQRYRRFDQSFEEGTVKLGLRRGRSVSYREETTTR